VRQLPLEEAVARIQRGMAAAAATGEDRTAPEDVRPTLSEPAERDPEQGIVWIDILRPDEADGELLREQLGFHPLAVEDCLYGKQTPKLERYPGYFFLVLYAARINPERNRPAFYELHCFLGSHYIVTVRNDSVREVRALMARWRGGPQHFPGVGHIAHGIA